MTANAEKICGSISEGLAPYATEQETIVLWKPHYLLGTGEGLRGNKKYYRNPELAKKEENGANKRPRGITRRRRIGEKPTQ